MNSQIRYLAIVTEQPETLAGFYSKYFSLRELGRSYTGDIALTDGFYNVSLLRPRQGARERGLSHFGITIDNIDAIVSRLKNFTPEIEITPEPGGLCHGDYRITDPFGQVVSLSTHDFYTPRAERGLPCIRHIALCVPNNDQVLDFYVRVFGFRESSTSRRLREQQRRTRWGADGETALAILPDHAHREIDENESPKDGLNHFGWLVSDIDRFLGSLPEGCVSKRPSSRPMAEYRGFDPDRNPFDISQDKGYEIDIHRWVHG